MALNRLRIAGLVLLCAVTFSCGQSKNWQAQQESSLNLPLEAAMDRIDVLIAQREWLAARAEMTIVLEAINRNRPLYGSQTRGDLDKRFKTQAERLVKGMQESRTNRSKLHRPRSPATGSQVIG